MDEIPFLYMRSQVRPSEISDALASMFVPIFQFATAQGIAFAGPPTARYISFGPGMVTIEAGMPVVGPIEDADDIMAGTLVGGDVASTIHKGPYDRLNLAHEAIQQWMTDNGVDFLIDATHPFAQQISANARHAHRRHTRAVHAA